MLEIKDLFVSYGMMEVLHGISLNVQTGELVSVIGPNGAGKTTLIKTIMGLVQPKSGAVLYDGQDISHIPAHKRAEMGIGYVPEGRHVFGRLTVEENLAIGAYSSKDKEKLKRTLKWSMTFSRVSVNAVSSWPVQCLAVSSRCLRLAVR